MIGTTFHYPEEWGPSDARRLTCVCGNPDPFHADPPAPKPTPVDACKWDDKPRRNTFRVKKEDPNEEHSAWFLVMPGNYILAFNHCPDDKIDEARANWVAHTLNAEMARTALAPPPPPIAPPSPTLPDGWKLLKDTTYDERSWPEDASHENGNYSCQCYHCLRMFTGHKRRVCCKVCAVPQSQNPSGEQP